MCSEINKKDSVCCDVGEFREMYAMMATCFSGNMTLSDCSTVMGSMKKKDCCALETDNTEEGGCCR